MRDDLRDALAAIEGVERSEVELTESGPLAVRVQLARGVDRTAVAESVQRLLEAHGLRSRVAPDRRQPGPGAPPAPPSAPPRPAVGPGPAPGSPAPAQESPSPSRRASAGRGIEAVTVLETDEGLTVTVVADGERTATRRARRTKQALHEAIVAAVGELVDPVAPPVGLKTIEHSEAFAAMTVYLEGPDGQVRVGASLVAASHPYALAQAVWAALTA